MSKFGTFFKGLTWPGKIGMAVVLFGLIFGAKWVYMDSGWFPKSVKQSELVAVNDLPPLAYDKNASATFRAFPDTINVATISGTEIRAGIMGWNTQSGVLYANGGVLTTKGSLMEENGVKLRLLCQNDCGKQGEGLYTFIQDYAKGNVNTDKGYTMIAWMGDGVPSYIAGLNEQIEKTVGKEYICQVFTANGASFGEDKAIYKDGSFRQDPHKLRGSLWIGVILDGDWNILMKYADMNKIPVNNDLTTFDADAINWMAAPENNYIKAAEQYVAKVKETRKVVKNGKRTGRDTTVEVNGCVTWTPGDKIAFEKRGGVIVASTKDFGAQMPNTWIACKKWLSDNRSLTERFIYASALGGDQVKSHGSALKFASTISNKVYQDNTMSSKNWEDLFKGIQITDAQGNVNEVGGSRVFNLADMAEYFGLNGSTDKYKAVYTTFGDLDVKTYPEKVPSYPAYEDIVNLSYLTAVYNKNKATAGNVSLPQIKDGSTMTQLVSAKQVTIEFDFGKATIKPSSFPVLEQLAKDFLIADNLLVTIEGHTDNVGSAEANKRLSEERANSVKNWFMNKDGKSYKNKITTHGFGSEKPVADNETKIGQAKNRRVEIKMGR